MPYGIVTGPDGNLWFSESQGNKIGIADLFPDEMFLPMAHH
jgi:streptogramin lyase